MEDCWDADPMRRPNLVSVAISIADAILDPRLSAQPDRSDIQKVPNCSIVPPSWFLSTKVVLESLSPFSVSSNWDVYSGRIGEILVTLKALRVHNYDQSRVQKVRHSSVTTPLLRLT